METFHSVVAFLTGLVVGSFLNVVIHRLPRGENLSRPRSRCPGCGKLIVWYDNIPVLSWLLLRARCRGCKTPIAFRYPFVELLTGVLFLLAWLALGPDYATAALVSVYLAALVSVSFIDIDWQIIPDRITKPGMVFFFVLAPLNALLAGDPQFVAGVKPALSQWIHAAAGIATGTGIVLLIRVVFTPIFKKEAMGLGDLKLLGLIGAVVGPLHVLYTLALASLSGAIVGGGITLLGRLRPLPCALRVRAHDPEAAGDLEASFESMRFGGAGGVQFVLSGAPAAPVGTELDLDLVVSYQRVLEDADARMSLRGRIAKTTGSGAEQKWFVETHDVSERDNHRLWIFKKSYSHIKFGPFLALGGAITALYGDQVHWFLTQGYPAYVRSLLGS
jgi:leader peptidase (prepilin peptidase)/N-methyltransferase